MKRSEAEQKINAWLDKTHAITGKTIIDYLTENKIMVPINYWVKTEDMEDDGCYGYFLYKWEAESTCIDCGAETKPGPGSARCKECWDDKCGV